MGCDSQGVLVRLVCRVFLARQLHCEVGFSDVGQNDIFTEPTEVVPL